MILDVAVPVVVGSVIGYVTNRLAIKMLFWPHNPVRVLGVRLPLTPGLFVKRRREFSTSISELVEEKFVNADEFYAAFKRAQDQGLVANFVEEMGPVFKVVWNLYAARVDAEAFKSDLDKITGRLKSGRVLSKTMGDKIDSMSSVEVEAMVMAVVHRELRGITWCGAALGAAIGMIQVFF